MGILFFSNLYYLFNELYHGLMLSFQWCRVELFEPQTNEIEYLMLLTL